MSSLFQTYRQGQSALDKVPSVLDWAPFFSEAAPSFGEAPPNPPQHLFLCLPTDRHPCSVGGGVCMKGIIPHQAPYLAATAVAWAPTHPET